MHQIRKQIRHAMANPIFVCVCMYNHPLGSNVTAECWADGRTPSAQDETVCTYCVCAALFYATLRLKSSAQAILLCRQGTNSGSSCGQGRAPAGMGCTRMNGRGRMCQERVFFSLPTLFPRTWYGERLLGCIGRIAYKEVDEKAMG